MATRIYVGNLPYTIGNEQLLRFLMPMVRSARQRS